MADLDHYWALTRSMLRRNSTLSTNGDAAPAARISVPADDTFPQLMSTHIFRREVADDGKPAAPQFIRYHASEQAEGIYHILQDTVSAVKQTPPAKARHRAFINSDTHERIEYSLSEAKAKLRKLEQEMVARGHKFVHAAKPGEHHSQAVVPATRRTAAAISKKPVKPHIEPAA